MQSSFPLQTSALVPQEDLTTFKSILFRAFSLDAAWWTFHVCLLQNLSFLNTSIHEVMGTHVRLLLQKKKGHMSARLPNCQSCNFHSIGIWGKGVFYFMWQLLWTIGRSAAVVCVRMWCMVRCMHVSVYGAKELIVAIYSGEHDSPLLKMYGQILNIPQVGEVTVTLLVI